MGTVRKTRLIVPCYNEAKRLNPEAFLRALDHDRQLFLLFVDDGSSDKTVDVLTSMKEKNPVQIELMRLNKNSGKAEAVRRGILASIEGPFENLGYWDADLATPLDALSEFCRLLESPEVDMVIGSRVRLLGRRVERSAARHYLGRVFATCASIMLDICIYDTQCGAKLFKNSEILRRVFGTPFKVKWTFDVEMLARFPIVTNQSPQQICSRWIELPLTEWVDVKGSKVTFEHYLKSGIEYGVLLYYLRTPARKEYKKYLFESALTVL